MKKAVTVIKAYTKSKENQWLDEALRAFVSKMSVSLDRESSEGYHATCNPCIMHAFPFPFVPRTNHQTKANFNLERERERALELITTLIIFYLSIIILKLMYYLSG